MNSPSGRNPVEGSFSLQSAGKLIAIMLNKSKTREYSVQ